jgi:glucokinase
MSEQHFIGIEIGGTKLQLVIADASLIILDHIFLEVNQQRGANGIQQQIEAGIDQLKRNRTVAAIGVGFGGPINYKTGTISTSHQIGGWNDFNLKGWLESFTNVPVFVDNDANVAALGEAVHGAARFHDLVFYMTIGSGIGGGFVANKQIYHGALPGEVEVGHLRLNKHGDTLESCCSGWAVDEKVRSAIQANPGGPLATLAADATKGQARFLKDAVAEGDAAAYTILQSTADDLAFALSHVVHLFHPEIIIVGGGLSMLGKPFTDAISSALPKYLLKSFVPAPHIKTAALREMVVPIGALQLAKASLNHLNNK